MQYVISDVSTFSSNIAMDKNVSVPQLPDQIMSPAMDQQFAFPVIDVTQKTFINEDNGEPTSRNGLSRNAFT